MEVRIAAYGELEGLDVPPGMPVHLVRQELRRRALADPDERVRHRALWYVGGADGLRPEDERFLLAAFDDPETRVDATRVLAHGLLSSELIAALVERAASPSAEIRSAAAWVLSGLTDDPAASAAMDALTRDDEESVRVNVKAALKYAEPTVDGDDQGEGQDEFGLD